MIKIYKYELKITDEQTLRIPDPNGYLEFLTVQMQGDKLYLWAKVDTNPGAGVDVMKDVKFAVVGTGWPFEYSWRYPRYLGTVQHNGFVWHVFTEDVS